MENVLSAAPVDRLVIWTAAMATVRNPKASRIGESPYETDFIEVDLFDAIERYVEAKIVCSSGRADCADELKRMEAESVLKSVLQAIESR